LLPAPGRLASERWIIDPSRSLEPAGYYGKRLAVGVQLRL